jgi:hypothetical protein
MHGVKAKFPKRYVSKRALKDLWSESVELEEYPPEWVDLLTAAQSGVLFVVVTEGARARWYIGGKPLKDDLLEIVKDQLDLDYRDAQFLIDNGRARFEKLLISR